MPLNVDQTLIDAVKAAVEARVPVSSDDPCPPSAVRSYRWRSDPATPTMNATANGHPAAYPYVTGWPTGGAMQRQPPTFGDCSTGVPGRRELVLKVVFETTVETAQTPIEAAVEGAVYSLGPKLGIPWVGGWSLRKTRQIQNNAETGHARRLVATFALTVDVRPRNVDLAAE